MERRLEPEPALRGEIGLQLHIGDQEAFLEHPAGEIQAQRRPHRRAHAVAGDQIVRLDRIIAIRRLHRGPHTVGGLRQRGEGVLEAQVDQVRKVPRALDQIFLDIVLLQVDEGGKAMPLLRLHVEGIDLGVAVEQPPHLPGHALVQHPLADPQARQDLQAALGPADRAAADRDHVIVVQHDAGDAMQCQVDGGTEPDRPGADNQHRDAPDPAVLQRGRRDIGKAGVLIACHDPSPDFLLSVPDGAVQAPSYFRTCWSIAPNTEPRPSTISMRIRSPKRMNGVCGWPPSMVSTMRTSAMQE